MSMRLDLHIHSTASDGEISPAEVREAAVAARLDVIALADHDTIAGSRSLLESQEQWPIQIIPALEVSSTLDRRELHFLGYFVDPYAPVLEGHQRRAVEGREKRMREMVKRLQDQGIGVEFEAVVDAAGPEYTTLVRPHLAQALVSAGHAKSTGEAFGRLIGDHCPAFLPTSLLSPEEAIEMIRGAGGIPVWAHPPADLLNAALPRFIQVGLGGLEVYRPRSSSGTVLGLEQAARRAGLMMSGGSDWHSSSNGVELGDFFITAEEVADLLEAGGI